MAARNLTAVTEFILIGFPNHAGLEALFFILLLFAYLISVVGNIAIIFLTRVDPHLDTPMYFLLANLSFLDICYISVTVPKMLVSLVAKKRSITYVGCMAQLFFIIFLEGGECFLLAIMAVDRYLAICNPLRYNIIMNRGACSVLVLGALLAGSAHSLLHTLLICWLPFCRTNEINHFFCDIPPLLKLSCSSIYVNEVVLYAVSGVFVGLGPLLFIFLSYVCIISAILRMRSVEGRHKIFSTCTSHLLVVALFYGTGSFTYVRPATSYAMDHDKQVSLLYNVLTPLLNPIIYSLRNSEVKRALRNTLRRFCVQT
ncbi:olfactory receptor 5V1-like [Ambystoma mexicanum]|uniref:olfactory receptor 5V1-like n=1 Tax=Ambystoma mexicanum TaxID=8296 RepID=UPI0037E89229